MEQYREMFMENLRKRGFRDVSWSKASGKGIFYADACRGEGVQPVSPETTAIVTKAIKSAARKAGLI